jgi:hypothetical protein
MIWNCYLTIFRAESPVHIGYKQIGILKTTRYYITGRAMWGAITANLTRALFENPSPKDYEVVGNFVRENIRTTYFYPAIKKNDIKDPEKWSEIDVKDYLVFLPNYIDDGLRFGKISKEEFEQIFVGSLVSTALEVSTKTAEEGSLHEFEFIKDKVKIGESVADVYWIGYLFINMDAKEAKDDDGKKVYDVIIEETDEDIKIIFAKNGRYHKNHLKNNILNQLFVGGERNYGLGRLKLLELTKETCKIFEKFDLEFNDENPILENNSDKNSAIAIAHVNLNGLELELGEIEPIVGLEWSDRGAGQKVSDAEICVTPGSKLKSCNFILCDYGILKAIKTL